MNIEQIKRKVSAALNKLEIEDIFLLENDVSERAITHKLAIYVAERFPSYDVDCEYNSNIQNQSRKKYIYILREKAQQLDLLRESDCDDELLSRIVYPDVIVHKRGFNDSNLLIIEVKKSSSQADSTYDHEKLSRYTSSDYDNDLNYKYGVFIELGVKGRTGFIHEEWFENGELIT